MGDPSKLKNDLPPEVRDDADLIADGLLDETEALEEAADRAEAAGRDRKTSADEASPARSKKPI